MYFSMFAPKQVNCFLNSNATPYKIIINVRSIMKSDRNFLGTLYFKLHNEDLYIPSDNGYNL